MINGVQVKRLEKHVDSRGYFMELLRESDPFFNGFGQWSESKMVTGTIKAWHLHQIQSDYWRVPIGIIRAVLCDMRKDSSTQFQICKYILGDDQEPIIIKIPPGVAHGCKVMQGPALLTYITSHTYNPEDEGRIAFDDTLIGYDWETEEIK
jgi:dTDP-4-dehydrorhamnose 3,5-epimerase